MNCIDVDWIGLNWNTIELNRRWILFELNGTEWAWPWPKLDMYVSEFVLNWMGAIWLSLNRHELEWLELFCVKLILLELYWIGWNFVAIELGLNWTAPNKFDLTWLDLTCNWIELKVMEWHCIVMRWMELNWMRLRGLSWRDLDRIVRNWTVLIVIVLSCIWIEVNWMQFNWTWIDFDWIWIHLVELD